MIRETIGLGNVGSAWANVSKIKNNVRQIVTQVRAVRRFMAGCKMFMVKRASEVHGLRLTTVECKVERVFSRLNVTNKFRVGVVFGGHHRNHFWYLLTG